MGDQRPMGWGLIGCGDIARKRVAPAIRDHADSDLIAVSRARSDLAESFAREFGAQRWYADWRDLLTDDAVEAVYVATPVHLHSEQVIAAAEAGCHVLCEKPMALDRQQCDRMLDACRASGVALGVAYYRHFYPVLERVRTLLLDGAIGQPIHARVEAFERFNPPPGADRSWLLDPSQGGGGPMMDFGCHRIEVLLHLLGPIREATGHHAHILFQRAVEDTSIATFRFESGALATLTVSHATWEPRDSVQLDGSEGSISIPVLNRGEMVVRTARGERVETHPPHANLHLPSIVDFVAAVRERRAPGVDGAMGREVTRIEDLLYQR
ncbi:MAG: Gfo/Idh/MocA family protein [Blastocatellia bacterium]|jgi:predicted dehydrogenase